MKDGKHPNPNTIHPIAGYDKEIYVKPTITNPNIIVGDFTYIADSDFESHVSHLYEWNDDKLIIGKFCQIAAGVEFVMNGANHQMNAVSTFPFYTLEGWEMSPPAKTDLPLKGDTVIENDVWIGQNSVLWVVSFRPSNRLMIRMSCCCATKKPNSSVCRKTASCGIAMAYRMTSSTARSSSPKAAARNFVL